MILSLCLITVSQVALSQYEFHNESRVACTEIKSQDRTGTCWSFSTASFIESELIRMGKGSHDLSEMFVVRNIYQDKARNYMLRQGAANFSQGALAHDLIRVYDMYGAVPENVYSGLVNENEKHDHSELERGLKGYLDGVGKGKTISENWPVAVEGILDAYLGSFDGSNFKVEGKSFDSKSYAKNLGIDPADYISLTSFNHHPFNSEFVLEIPDNYSNGSYYNISLPDLMSTVDHALENGYTIAWDGDVSEKTFSAKNGLAILPEDPSRDSLYQVIGNEIEVTQEKRQRAFESLETTDDHLMHIIGIAQDEKGTKYYIVKNSWGSIGPFEGYVYMSEAYLKMKTVGILLHVDAIPKSVSKKIIE